MDSPHRPGSFRQHSHVAAVQSEELSNSRVLRPGRGSFQTRRQSSGCQRAPLARKKADRSIVADFRAKSTQKAGGQLRAAPLRPSPKPGDSDSLRRSCDNRYAGIRSARLALHAVETDQTTRFAWETSCAQKSPADHAVPNLSAKHASLCRPTSSQEARMLAWLI